MEQIFINVLAQELIKAKELAEKAELLSNKNGSNCFFWLLLSIPNATEEDYEQLSFIPTITNRILPNNEGIAFVFADDKSKDPRIPNLAAFTYLTNECDNYSWTLQYFPI